MLSVLRHGAPPGLYRGLLKGRLLPSSLLPPSLNQSPFQGLRSLETPPPNREGQQGSPLPYMSLLLSQVPASQTPLPGPDISTDVPLLSPPRHLSSAVPMPQAVSGLTVTLYLDEKNTASVFLICQVGRAVDTASAGCLREREAEANIQHLSWPFLFVAR